MPFSVGGPENPHALLPVHGHRRAHHVLLRGRDRHGRAPRARGLRVAQEQDLVAAGGSGEEVEVLGLLEVAPRFELAVGVHELDVADVDGVVAVGDGRIILLLCGFGELKHDGGAVHQHPPAQERLLFAEDDLRGAEREIALRGLDVEAGVSGRGHHDPVGDHRPRGAFSPARGACGGLPGGDAVGGVVIAKAPTAKGKNFAGGRGDAAVPPRGLAVAGAEQDAERGAFGHGGAGRCAASLRIQINGDERSARGGARENPRNRSH